MIKSLIVYYKGVKIQNISKNFFPGMMAYKPSKKKKKKIVTMLILLFLLYYIYIMPFLHV